jgi:hypothetical protein
MDQANMMRPVQMADTYYYGIQPAISKAAAEMDDMSMAYPTQGMFEPMLDRVYDEVGKMYPEEMQDQAPNFNGVNPQPGYHAQQFFPGRRRRFFRDLLGILLLQELLCRRGRCHR